ncbi:MAG: hypothetical protein A2V65_08805 [Deltaproteobacteria bacterium RBG_13_49_15]|nr:MAG: hypothetical protein A2V65_08805 [Deltaproteobacteria bacterium RBG_13_49_15]
MGKKKKWYDTWWGALWTLAIMDAHPGHGLKVFMEVDRALQNLPEFSSDNSVEEGAHQKKEKAIISCPENAPAGCSA